MQMGMYMREIGLMIKLMALVCTLTWMEPDMKGNGKWINNMERVKRSGQTMPDTKETIIKERSMDKVFSNGQTVLLTRDSLKIIILMELEHINGQMEESSQVNGE